MKKNQYFSWLYRYLKPVLAFIAITSVTILIVSTSTCRFIPFDKSDGVPNAQSRQISQSGSKSTTYESYIIKKGDTFGKILQFAGVAGIELSKSFDAISSMDNVVLFPGDSVVIRKKPSGSLASISILSARDIWYIFELADSLTHLYMRPAKVDTVKCYARASIDGSLSNTLNKIGIGNGFVHAFVDLFAWDIDFFSDPQPGDTVEATYEELYVEGKFAGYGGITAAGYKSGNRHLFAIGIRDSLGKISYYDANGKSMRKVFLKTPLDYARISSGFTMKRKHPVLGYVTAHPAIDYAAPSGTPVYSVGNGVVKFAGRNGGFGLQVKIRHGNGYETWYSHLRSVGKSIRPGYRVAQQEAIGQVGSTGLSTGPHVDFRMLCGTAFVNPRTATSVTDDSAPIDKQLFESEKQGALALFGEYANKPFARYALDNSVAPKSIVLAQTATGSGYGSEQGRRHNN